MIEEWPETPIERAIGTARVKDALADQRRAFEQNRTRDAEEEARQKERLTARRLAKNLKHRGDTYRAAGLDVPAGDDFPSLPMMLQAGYRIEDSGHGIKVLIAPTSPPPQSIPRRETKPQEMGS